MKKIGIFLGDVQGNGGIGRVTWIIANKLNAYYELHVLSAVRSRAKKYFYSEDVPIEYLFDSAGAVHSRFFKLTEGIRTFVYKNQLDVLICAGAIYYPACVVAIRFSPVRLICWEHSNVSVVNEHKFQRTCRRLGATFADYIVPLTRTDEHLYKQKYHVKNCRGIYNPVDDRLLGTVDYQTNSQKVISVGRLCYQKNFEELVDVAHIFLEKNLAWTWDIFGEGENREAIQAKIDAYCLNDRLTLRGRVTDLYERYDQYSMIVMTSRFEGFPMTLLESTARGIPAVAYDVLTGPNEVIEEGKTGYLIQEGNIESMAEKMQRLVDDAALRAKMSQCCVEKRNSFSCKNIIDEWRVVLDTVGS